ncbi:MAG: response regulator, partial [Oscillospiraceae bacterium]|nr:response regulator [Oscillospiraceae bacterium]
SSLLRKLISDGLISAGYTNLTVTMNGMEAWNVLESFKNMPGGAPISNFVDLVITDIEMPQMDGHHLCKQIKTDPKLSSLPVIIFSSLIDEAMEAKGREVGADAQLAKPDIALLVSLIRDLTNTDHSE